jgi:hypothetical protein
LGKAGAIPVVVGSKAPAAFGVAVLADTTLSVILLAQVLAAGAVRLVTISKGLVTISKGRGMGLPEQAPHGHCSMSCVTPTFFSLSTKPK